MKSSFSKIFFPTVVIVLVAMVCIGLFFQLQVRNIMKDRAMERLETGATTISKLATAYHTDNAFGREQFFINLSVAITASEFDAVICDKDGKLVLCADDPLKCSHQGMMVSKSYLEQVMRTGKVKTTGKIRGLYTDSRYVVGMPIYDAYGRGIGIVMASAPTAETTAVMNQMAKMFLITSILVVLLALTIIWYFVRRQSKPLRDMARAARSFGHGELEARVSVDKATSEEMQELALAFNNMAASLQQSEVQRQEFVANISHELKTPMTTISGYVDGILDGTIPQQRQDHYLKLVSDETKRLSRLVRSMLDISRLQDQGGMPEEKKHRFDVTETAGQVLITFEKAIVEKQLQVQVQMPDHPVYTNAAADAITQVIYNLVDNAVKFCPQGGKLGLQIREGGQKLYVSVSNEGPTIPPQELPMVFDRFHKLDKSRSRNRDGWGLGLYIVKTIVCSHGEDISVTSRDGVTEFTFTLPLVN